MDIETRRAKCEQCGTDGRYIYDILVYEHGRLLCDDCDEQNRLQAQDAAEVERLQWEDRRHAAQQTDRLGFLVGWPHAEARR